MSQPLVPVGGDPATARALADALAGQSAWVGALERVLRGLAEGDVSAWDGPAGRAFSTAALRHTPVLRRVAHRYAVAAAVVRRLADAVEQAQAECAAALRVHEPAEQEVIAIGEARVLAQQRGDPASLATLPRLTADLLAAGERASRAVEQHRAAWEVFRAVDRSCAAVLSGLTRDGLADTRGYDLLTGTSRAAGEIEAFAAVPAALPLPPLRVFDVVEEAAGAVAVVADAATWAVYGDGDVTTIALAGVSTAAGPLSSVLKRGAQATNAAETARATTRSHRAALRLSTVDRIRHGLTSRSTPPKPTSGAPWVRPPRGSAALRRWAADRAQARATAILRRRWLDDLDAVTRTPGTSTPMLVTAIAVEESGGVLGRLGTVGEHVSGRREDARREAVRRRHDP